MWLTEFLWALAFLGGLALMGGFVVVPFRRALRFPGLVAPAAGIVCLGLATAAVYAVLGVSLKFSVVTAFCGCTCLTALAIAFSGMAFRSIATLFSPAVLLVVGLIAVRTCEATTLRLGTPAILYIDGTDHLGYSHVADWLIGHPVAHSPTYDAAEPYQAYPAMLFRGDPRFGSFFFLAACALVRGLPATFTYDFACAVGLAAMLAGVAGTFVRSRLTLALLLGCLFVCQWYDLANAGFFGKLLAYPAALIVTGLYLNMAGDLDVPSLCALAALSAGAAIFQSGLATALIFASTITAYLLAGLARAKGGAVRALRDRCLAGALAIGTMIVATGLPARPAQTAFPDVAALGWRITIARLLDLKTLSGAQHASSGSMDALILVSLVLWGSVLILGVLRRDPRVIGLAAGVAVVCVGVSSAWGQSGALQLVGIAYPLVACSAASLLDSVGPSQARLPLQVSLRTGAAVICVILLCLRIPRMSFSLRRYASRHAPKSAQFSIDEADRLATAAAGRRMGVDVTSPQEVIFLLVELGRRNVRLQWSARSWDVAVGYTGWPPPKYDAPSECTLVSSRAPLTRPSGRFLETPHFVLVEGNR